MGLINKVTYEEFSDILTLRNVRELQIIYFALGFGIFIFNILLFFTYNLISEYVSDANDSYIFILTVIHFLLLFSAIPLSKFLFEQILKSNRLSKFSNQNVLQSGSEPEVKPAQSLWYRIRLAHIVRLVIFESIAIFGLVVCTLAAFDGILHAHPIYWINLLSSFIFVLFLVYNFPTVEKLGRFFREYLQGDPLLHFDEDDTEK